MRSRKSQDTSQETETTGYLIIIPPSVCCLFSRELSAYDLSPFRGERRRQDHAEVAFRVNTENGNKIHCSRRAGEYENKILYKYWIKKGSEKSEILSTRGRELERSRAKTVNVKKNENSGEQKWIEREDRKKSLDRGVGRR